MPLPRVLIIGAMKAGTTSLYMDLANHPQGFLAHDKEPHALCSDDVLTDRGKAEYEAIYRKAGADRFCCDASTGYAKRPDFEGVAARAAAVLPDGFKVIYLVRHPIQRIISQHVHEVAEGRVGPSIDEVVRQHPRYIHYSRYAYQIQPWIDAIGWERIRIVRFEDYTRSRQEIIADLCEFVGLSAADYVVRAGDVYNRSEGKPTKTPFWHLLQHHPTYRRLIRPLMPVNFRLAVRRIVLPKFRSRLEPPRADTLQFLRESLMEDVQRLSALLGQERLLWPDFHENIASVP